MIRRIVISGALLVALTAGGLLYGQVAARTASGTPPPMAPVADQADLVRVDKSDRRLELLRDGAVIAAYDISLGAAPDGHKRQEGDERTPEGRYVIDWRNPNSIAHLSLHISYPNADDVAQAAAAGVSPGGNIMIHGLPNGFGILGRLHLLVDWTDGCIAVTDAEMREIWSRVPNGTPIELRG
ncbi:L,D-transpeptidase family protein [Pontivivens ytuae]|uniref:L,D-transpeptidase family protein n=1 Tax=Pontivivens ytuae TaxID=2789856 RepID=A0A7S9LUH2_9RHOB|nr:L,D-transpeptidase family protein [Pontivivens ytuae]QPH55225.1 L,D-transpeptidase family protein [Pontivivens ytuae]